MPTVAPIAGPVCEVVTVAKRDLKAGERLDGIGGFCTYGLIDNAAAARAMAALPIGLSEGCVLRRDVSKDDVDLVRRCGCTPWRAGRDTLAGTERTMAPIRTQEHTSSTRHALRERSDEGCVVPRRIRHASYCRAVRSRCQTGSMARWTGHA